MFAFEEEEGEGRERRRTNGGFAFLTSLTLEKPNSTRVVLALEDVNRAD